MCLILNAAALVDDVHVSFVSAPITVKYPRHMVYFPSLFHLTRLCPVNSVRCSTSVLLRFADDITDDHVILQAFATLQSN